MTQFETSQYALLLANNEGQSREIKRLQVEAKQMRVAFRDLDLYCGQLEKRNRELEELVMRLESLKNLPKAWGY